MAAWLGNSGLGIHEGVQDGSGIRKLALIGRLSMLSIHGPPFGISVVQCRFCGEEVVMFVDEHAGLAFPPSLIPEQ